MKQVDGVIGEMKNEKHVSQQNTHIPDLVISNFIYNGSQHLTTNR
jgi:hypothetical protein